MCVECGAKESVTRIAGGEIWIIRFSWEDEDGAQSGDLCESCVNDLQAWRSGSWELPRNSAEMLKGWHYEER